MIDPLLEAILALGVKVALDRRARRKVLGQQGPRTPAAQQVEKRVDHLAQVRRAGPAQGFGRQLQRLDQRPHSPSVIPLA